VEVKLLLHLFTELLERKHLAIARQLFALVILTIILAAAIVGIVSYNVVNNKVGFSTISVTVVTTRTRTLFSVTPLPIPTTKTLNNNLTTTLLANFTSTSTITFTNTSTSTDYVIVAITTLPSTPFNH
jgi:hypothetical protein